jgi:hypothetical protein
VTPLITTTIAISIVLINGLIGHFFAPSGIFLTPVVLTLTTWLIVAKTERLSVLWKSLLVFGCVALNDILLKLFAGGTHDNEGYAWMLLLMLIGLLLGYVIMLVNILRTQEVTAHKIIALVVFPLLVFVHLELSSNLGIGRSYWYGWNN